MLVCLMSLNQCWAYCGWSKFGLTKILGYLICNRNGGEWSVYKPTLPNSKCNSIVLQLYET